MVNKVQRIQQFFSIGIRKIGPRGTVRPKRIEKLAVNFIRSSQGRQATTCCLQGDFTLFLRLSSSFYTLNSLYLSLSLTLTLALLINRSNDLLRVLSRIHLPSHCRKYPPWTSLKCSYTSQLVEAENSAQTQHQCTSQFGQCMCEHPPMCSVGISQDGQRLAFASDKASSASTALSRQGWQVKPVRVGTVSRAQVRSMAYSTFQHCWHQP